MEKSHSLLPASVLQANGAQQDDIYSRFGLQRQPYPSYLSFAPLLRRVEEKHTMGCTENLLVQELLQRLDQAPQLREPITGLDTLGDQQELLDLMLGLVLSPFTRETQLAKVAAPFDLNPAYITPALRRLGADNEVTYEMGQSNDFMYAAMIVRVCSCILNQYYGQNLAVEPPVSITATHRQTGLTRYFKTRMDMQFIDIEVNGELPPISQEEIHELLSNIYDVDLWLRRLPPDKFTFHGFAIGLLVDITEEEALSRLKLRLLSQDAIVSADRVRELEGLLRTYFRIPDLRMGITAIDYPPESAVDHKYKIRFDFLAERHPKLLSEANRNSIYEKACRFREVVLQEDLEQLRPRTPVERDLLEQGIRSIIVAPLFNQHEEVIGLLEIATPRPYELHSFVELKFQDIIGLFSLAIERSRDEIDNQIEAVVREQFTAVHPVVEWRFIEASYNLLERRARGRQATMEPIVFPDVYALYGQADIVGSSEQRNEAIRADLVQNLQLARRVIDQCLQSVPFPLLDQMRYRLQRTLGELEQEFNSSDETRVVDLLQQELHPLLDNLATSQNGLAGHVAGYFNQLDPDLGIVYRKRKAYEASVSTLTSAIANYLDEQEQVTQPVTPHYFEKYKTDGVEYDIYVGQSLLKQGTFCQTHFRNLRLWQLMHMVEITRRVEAMRQELAVPLTTAQLVFAYNAPLSIRFRMDEKQFDVDGAYNVRYQILKKRIDKATIQGSDERLTQSGHVAIVYLQERDRDEYLEYLDYLRDQHMLNGPVEDLALSRMQGVQGLRALRFRVPPKA